MPLTQAERDELWTAYDRWIDQEGEDVDGSLGRTALRGLRQLLADSAALAELREQLAHLQSDAGPDSCADVMAKYRGLRERVEKLEREWLELVAAGRRLDKSRDYCHAVEDCAEQLRAAMEGE